MRSSSLILTVLVALSLLSIGTATGTTYLVRPDGTGDYPTIQAAISASIDGDIIELADGVYRGEGNRDVIVDHSFPFTIKSQSGTPSDCVIDCEGSSSSPHRFLDVSPPDFLGYSSVEGITVLSGFEHHGGAIRSDVAFHIRNCVFIGCQSNSPSDPGFEKGGAICFETTAGSYCWITQCSFHSCSAEGGEGGAIWSAPDLFLNDCTFQDCTAEANGGSVYGYAIPQIANCDFSGGWVLGDGGFVYAYAEVYMANCRLATGNASQGGGAVRSGYGSIFEDCVFLGNGRDAKHGGAIRASGDVTIRQCTFAGNWCCVGGSAVAVESGRARLIESAFAFNRNNEFCEGGLVVECMGSGSILEVSCCDVYGNDGGDWAGCIADQAGMNGNFSADPLFCGPEDGDFRLSSSSPCLEALGCGQVGALGLGCTLPGQGENDAASISVHVTSPDGLPPCEHQPFVTNRTMLTERCSGGDAYPYDAWVWVLVCNGSEEVGIAGMECGIQYDAAPGTGVDVNGWTSCADAEMPVGAWPGSGSGNVVSWDPVGNCQNENSERYVPGTVVAIAGVLNVTVWSPGRLEITPLPSTGRAKVTDCRGLWTDITDKSPSHLGVAGFCMSGWNPCGAPTPVQATTWGRLKQMFGGKTQ